MTIPKTAPGTAPPDGAHGIDHPQPLVRTQELPVIGPTVLGGKTAEGETEAVPWEIADGDVTVPVLSSIEGALTLEVLRRQSSKADDEDETP